jgi:hypothetical protein
MSNEAMKLEKEMMTQSNPSPTKSLISSLQLEMLPHTKVLSTNYQMGLFSSLTLSYSFFVLLYLSSH